MPKQENPKFGKYNGMRVQRYSYRTASLKQSILVLPRELLYTLEDELTKACHVGMKDNHVVFVIETWNTDVEIAGPTLYLQDEAGLSWFDVHGTIVLFFTDSKVYVGLGEESLIVGNW